MAVKDFIAPLALALEIQGFRPGWTVFDIERTPPFKRGMTADDGKFIIGFGRSRS